MNPKALEKYRLRKGLTITELARMMGKTPGWYSKIRHGKQALSSRHIVPLARIFGISSEKLAREYFAEPKLEETSSSDLDSQQTA
ncbi:helix-turn-helix domain-containing protein [Alicyclobacillus macrosporangiidus]|uniref:helix-turn-helix domain-containing protein n=1 Tax=Alicyclobacillus macrosporangiidus TaxID=392015 RepID=UPI000496F98A|nr:helix-turn-helix transcriptional regulator [Alicyclobacillus macrosporangiidus]